MVKTIKEQVFSKIHDPNIRKDIWNSKIWKQAKHAEDVTASERHGGFIYTILFEGVRPINVTSIRKA